MTNTLFKVLIGFLVLSAASGLLFGDALFNLIGVGWTIMLLLAMGVVIFLLEQKRKEKEDNK